MRKGGSKTKGSDFERSISKKLSLWWTQDLEKPREDIFWLTSGSGARATSRSKNKKKTAYEYGDISFTDPLGKPFIDCFLIECKCGYSNDIDILELFHKEENSYIYFWWRKALKEAEEADREHIMLIVKRNRKPELCFLDRDFINYSKQFIGETSIQKIEIYPNEIICIKFDDFLNTFDPEIFKVLWS